MILVRQLIFQSSDARVSSFEPSSDLYTISMQSPIHMSRGASRQGVMSSIAHISRPGQDAVSGIATEQFMIAKADASSSTPIVVSIHGRGRHELLPAL